MSIVKPNPSIVVDYQAPEFIRSDYAKFITFLQKYYEYLEQSNKALGVIRNLETYNDIDEQTDNDIITTFYTLFLPDFPQVLSADKKFILKNIAEFYNSKGSIDSIKSFFRILYGEEVDVYLPKVDILKLDAGIWTKVFKIKILNLSSGTISQLVNSEIYQIDQINGNITVRAKVIDYDVIDNVLYLTADNVVLNFSTLYPVYATNSAGISVTFDLEEQLSQTSITYSGLGYIPGDDAILSTAVSNTEDIKVDGITAGYVQDIVLESPGDNYSVFDTISFGTLTPGDRAATAKIARTINKDIVSENGAITWRDEEDSITYEDGFEIRQEMGTFGSEASTSNLKLSDETSTNINTGSLSSNEFNFLLESQNPEIVRHSIASYTYNQGLFRAILPRIGAESNYSINWARNEGIAVSLNDEELWIGTSQCTTGTPSCPGIVIIEFDDNSDYNALERIEATNRSSVNAPVIGTFNGSYADQETFDTKIGQYSKAKQLGLYKFGQETLSPLYPFSEHDIESIKRPIVYIRERNTLYGHDLNTTRPWEYKFIFKKNSKVGVKIYIMPTQYDIRATQILDEDGSDYIAESNINDTFILENWEQTINVTNFDPATAVSSNQITLPSHPFKNGEIVRFNTTTDPVTGVVSETMGGATDGELFHVYVVNANTIKLIPYGRENLNYELFRTITAAATSGTTNTICSFVGSHVTSGVDYTSSAVEDSAIMIYARKRSCGSRDLDLDYNIDPNIPTDSDTNLKTTYPYTVDNKVYLYPAINEHVDYIIMERADFATSDQVNLEMEIDKRSINESEEYAVFPYIALETAENRVIQNIKQINIPDYSSVRVMVERKVLQSVDDINRGEQRLAKIWDDYAEISPAQELFEIATPTYNDEYDETPYLTTAYPTNTSDYVSGPSEFSNLGSTVMIAASKNNSVYFTDGTGAGSFKFAAEFEEQRRISIIEQEFYDGTSLKPTTENGPLGITSSSSGAYRTNAKRYFTIGFSLPEELNAYFDIPFEVNLRNILDSLYQSVTTIKRDTREYITMEDASFSGESVYKAEDGEYLAYEINDFGFNSLAEGEFSISEPTLMLEFFSPSLAVTNPKKHIVFYSNVGEYTKVSSDVQRTIYTFLNCWSPNQNVVPDTTVKDYTLSIRSLQKNDVIIQKLSDTQLLANNPDNSAVDNTYISPFIKEVFITTGENDYGKYLKMYPTQADAIANTNSITPFSLGTNFGSNLYGNEMFYNPIVSGTTVNSTINNPLNSAFMGLMLDDNLSISRFFDPATDVTTGTPGTITIQNHGFADGSWVRFRADFNGTLPTGLSDNTTYYIKVLTANTIRLATSRTNYSANTFVNLTAFGTAGKTCSLQTIPQSFTYNSIKENSFDTRKYLDNVQIASVDTISGTLTTSTSHTLRTLSTCSYTTSGTAIGGLISGKNYFAIFVAENQLRLALTKEDALAGIFIPLTSSGVGSQFIEIDGSNGNMLPNPATNEQFFYTPNYKNYYKNGDEVIIAQQRKLSPGISSGQTMYVKDSISTGTQEHFTVTSNANGTTINFGTVSTNAAGVNVSTNIITISDHGLYTGEEITYSTSGTSIQTSAGNLPATVYIIRVSSSTFRVASTLENSLLGTAIDITGAGSGTHSFYRTNITTQSEIAEIIPLSSKPNASMALNPSTTGTGYEEITFIFSDTLETETGVIDQILLQSPGSYKRIPTTSINVGPRNGSGASIYPIIKDIGKLRSLEILDGGLHNTTRTLILPATFIGSNITGTFVEGETVKVGATEVGTLVSVIGKYFKVKPNGGATIIAFGDTVTGSTSGATVFVGRNYTLTSVTIGANPVFTTNDKHYISRGDKVKVTGLSAQGIANGLYYAAPITNTTFRLFTTSGLATTVPTSGAAYVSGGSIIVGLYIADATASPGGITTSTANGSTVNYEGDKQLLNTTMKLQDSYYYQDYSYVVRGSNSYENWKPYFNKLVHPAGMAVFGEVDYFTTSIANEKLGNTEVTGSSINNTGTAITTETTT